MGSDITRCHKVLAHLCGRCSDCLTHAVLTPTPLQQCTSCQQPCKTKCSSATCQQPCRLTLDRNTGSGAVWSTLPRTTASTAEGRQAIPPLPSLTNLHPHSGEWRPSIVLCLYYKGLYPANCLEHGMHRLLQCSTVESLLHRLQSWPKLSLSLCLRTATVLPATRTTVPPEPLCNTAACKQKREQSPVCPEVRDTSMIHCMEVWFSLSARSMGWVNCS